MGEPNVISISISSFIGVGISFSRFYGEYGKALYIYISLPFIGIGIFTKKTKNNKWI